MIMQNFDLMPEEIIELRKQHKIIKDKKAAYKINAVILLGTGWTIEQVASALLLDEETLRNYVSNYKAGGVEKLINTNYKGSTAFLSIEQIHQLQTELDSKVYLTNKSIIDFVQTTFGINYSISGMTALLHRLDYIYKKPKLIPTNLDIAVQEEFIKCYKEFMLSKANNEAIFFVDAVHPEHNTMAAYGWLKKGIPKKLATHYGRQRLNLHGAINPETLDTFIVEGGTIDSSSTISLFETLENYYPLATKIYVILDNAGYHKSREVEAYLNNSRIKAAYLPSGCPNLNLIERLWKLLKRKVLYNRYFEGFVSFRNSCLEFFKSLTKHENELWNIMNDEFEIVSSR